MNRQAFEREKRLRSGELAKVGLNCFQEDETEPEVEFHPYREEEADKQIARLDRVRASRDTAAVEAHLRRLRNAAQAGDNVMPSILDAVEAHATVGEVCGVLKQTFGTYQEPIRF